MFVRKVREAIRQTGGGVCVGLDPHADSLPSSCHGPNGVRDFLYGVIDQTVEHACVYKPNSAFFEAMGPEGMSVLKQVIDRVHEAERPVILDAKRCDIGSTARAYATAIFDVFAADAVTVVPYTGADAVVPFMEKGGFAFLLTLPSNPAAQPIVQHGNPPLYVRVGEMAADLSERYPEQIGLVVGATNPTGAAALDKTAPGLPWLVPGVGAQGGDLGEFLGSVGGTRILLVNASRSILFAEDPGLAARTLKEATHDEIAQ